MNQASFSKGGLTASHFERLWTRMAESFGHKWTSNYGIEPNRSWIDGLADMSAEEIKIGLGNLRTWSNDEGWPPTLLQFRELCRPHATPAHTVYQPLPPPETSWGHRQDVAAGALAALREGALKPAIEGRQTGLSEEDRALVEQLDWARIAAVSEGDFATLAELDRPEPIRARLPEPMAACTCRLERSAANDWVRLGPVCPACKAWDERLSAMGVSGQARPVIVRKPGRPRSRQAA